MLEGEQEKKDDRKRTNNLKKRKKETENNSGNKTKPTKMSQITPSSWTVALEITARLGVVSEIPK